MHHKNHAGDPLLTVKNGVGINCVTRISVELLKQILDTSLQTQTSL